MFCELYSTTNGENFRTFLRLLKSKLRNQYEERKVYICLDNHGAHQCKESKRAMEELNFVPLFFPSYSCCFNSIETLWSFMKNHFRRFLCDQKTNLSLEEFKSKVRETLPLVTEEIAGNIYFANRKYLCEQL